MKILYSPHFARSYRKAPAAIRQAFVKQSLLLLQNLRHPSLHAKKYEESADLWQARVTSQLTSQLGTRGSQDAGHLGEAAANHDPIRGQHVDEKESSHAIGKRGRAPAGEPCHQAWTQIARRIQSGLGQRREQASVSQIRCQGHVRGPVQTDHYAQRDPGQAADDDSNSFRRRINHGSSTRPNRKTGAVRTSFRRSPAAGR